MQLRRLSWALLLIASLLGPDVALTMQTGRTQDACGMAVCCCPQKCKMAKKKMLACHRADRESCGIKAGTSKNNALASGDLSSPKFRIAVLSVIKPKTTQTFRIAAANLFLPDAHAPSLLKPPTSVS